ncbi:PilZ domain-containing protein [Paenibacillus glucanolyticus]|jgi:c-di-GMP-binding flagellar brake protein YcgR|uniref:PilZ domain-containing protein n=1 Tax=Paenibacillus glucanolyticus TaxID=59843 RepID=A0A163GT78_9BACL|nr:PilZ domain-containing protein [Paenibacillus glucanolyticus]KZS45136.1 hypothetical protein AWU65_03905 [Paenibacillus glucanolyticus]OMF65140.1 hypothetical protein BK142_31145 [Paenibacillus glucanolyticus]
MNIYKITESSLINCIVIIHTNQQTMGGNISYIEGDVFEICFSNLVKIELRQEIGVTIYSPDGLVVFETYPVASYENRLLCILPSDFQQRIINRRKDVRVPVTDVQCSILNMKTSRLEKALILDQSIPCGIQNVSMNGILFTLKSPLPLLVNDRLSISFLDHTFDSTIKHIKKSDQASDVQIGVEFQNLKEHQKQAIRSLIVNQQAANRLQQIEDELVEQV